MSTFVICSGNSRYLVVHLKDGSIAIFKQRDHLPTHVVYVTRDWSDAIDMLMIFTARSSDQIDIYHLGKRLFTISKVSGRVTLVLGASYPWEITAHLTPRDAWEAVIDELLD